MSEKATHQKLSRESAIVIGTLLVATFVVILNETLLGVALPNIMADLNITESTGQWLNTAFMLTMAVVIPTSGYLQVRFSRRRLFLIAMITFSIGTLLGAASVDFISVLIGRIIQAAGTSVMFPLLMTTIMVLVPETSRGKVMGNIGIVMSAAPAIGPSVSGLVLSFAHWRWLFIMVLPIAAVVTVLGASKVKSPHEKNKPAIDVLSVFISLFAFGGLVYGLSTFGDQARGTAIINPWIPLTIGALAMWIFIRRQNRLAKEDRALLNLNTFKSKNFTISTALLVVLCMSLFGLGLLVPIYTQNVLGLTPLVTGLILLPGSLFMGLVAPFVGQLSDRVGPEKLIQPGAIVLALAYFYMCTFDANTQIWQVFIGYFAMNVGLAFMFTPIFNVSVSSLEPKLYPHGTATVGAIQQVAGAAGTALFITIFTVTSVAQTAAGVDPIIAGATGIRWAFVSGAVLSLLVIWLAFQIKGKQKTAELVSEVAH